MVSGTFMISIGISTDTVLEIDIAHLLSNSLCDKVPCFLSTSSYIEVDKNVGVKKSVFEPFTYIRHREILSLNTMILILESWLVPVFSHHVGPLVFN